MMQKWWTRGESKPTEGFLGIPTISRKSLFYRGETAVLPVSEVSRFIPAFGPGDARVMQYYPPSAVLLLCANIAQARSRFNEV